MVITKMSAGWVRIVDFQEAGMSENLDSIQV
jgi:hypothetical protein